MALPYVDSPPRAIVETRKLPDLVSFFSTGLDEARYPYVTTRHDLELVAATVLKLGGDDLLIPNHVTGRIDIAGDKEFGFFFGPNGDDSTYRLIYNTLMNELRLESDSPTDDTNGSVFMLVSFANELQFHNEIVQGNDFDVNDPDMGKFAWPGLAEIQFCEDPSMLWASTVRLLSRCTHLEDRHVRQRETAISRARLRDQVADQGTDLKYAT